MVEHIVMPQRKRIAIIAHDNKKAELISCLQQHREVLSQHDLFGTGTTGTLVEEALNLLVTKFRSGPLGGDQQIGAKIASQELDIIFFLIDPLDSHPHYADVQALLRLAEAWNVVCGITTTCIDFILTSPKMHESCTRSVYLAPVLPRIEANKRKPLVHIVKQRVPAVNQNSKLTLPQISQTRPVQLTRQTIFKNY
ncbi:unnamed protein product [Rotaria magnacalcarata]|uniref:MGS-like domain-containing protein n=1 Tax=Rotaria magnacalcarata TaxID=392030 RepID=A0A819BX87_9BILA|nr:unnamed protein product [Rotaria magnacalcarata]CAF3798722.1 unnamed protein product [Rotaria magnacalcarata]